MFTNLIESQSHRREFKRRSSFFLITVAAYAVILFGAGIASIYAYDAQLEMQTNTLEVLSWVPAVTPPAPKPIAGRPQPVHRTSTTNAPVDSNISIAERRNAFASTNDPTKVPDHPGVAGAPDPPVTGPFVISGRDVDPRPPAANSTTCTGCSNTTQTVTITEKPPEPPPVMPPTTERVPSTVLVSKAISLPQPPYPLMAKQIRLQGAVNVQILVSEEGKVVSAQVVSGNGMLSSAAKDAAMRARFTPTILNGQPVKIQGVITYNFVLQ
jgi:protein TonB